MKTSDLCWTLIATSSSMLPQCMRKDAALAMLVLPCLLVLVVCLLVPLFVVCFSSHLVTKMKNVFEQVMMVDGQRRMRGDIIQKTFKV